MASTHQIIHNVFETHFDKIYRYFYAKTLSKEDAQDLTSETFLGLTNQVVSGRTIDNPNSYIYGIARNVFYSYLRSKYQMAEMSLDQLPDIATEIDVITSSEIDFAGIVNNLLPQVPEKQREVLHLRLISRLSLSEICQQLDKDMNYVKTTQKRGIQTLKQLLACTPLATNN